MRTLLIALLIFQTAFGAGPQTIGIFTIPMLELEWDPDSTQTGITGSEEAAIYISQKLANLGYNVIVYGNPPATSLHSMPDANPRFLKLLGADIKPLDIAVSWRMPKIAEALKRLAKKVYFWPHDVCVEKMAEIQNFDDIFWLSNWQREQWISLNPELAKFTKIFGNGINPDQFKEVQNRENPYSCIYGSNYARGLEILLNIWPAVKREFPKATLDIYYGWQHWGLLSSQRQEKMRIQITKLAKLGVKDHGLVGHDELNRAYEKAAFWTYPCIAPETFCITALRAQLAGAIPVIITDTALKETVPNGFQCTTAQKYLETLLKALNEAKRISLEERKLMGEFILEQYTWDKIALKWDEVFKSAY